MANEDYLIGQRLRRSRKDKGLSIHEVAQHLGCPPRRVSDYEAGRLQLRASQIGQLARLLDASPNYLINGDTSDSDSS